MKLIFARVGIKVGLFAFGATCEAQQGYKYFQGSDGTREVVVVDETSWQSRSGFQAYDNWRSATNGGQSRIRGSFVMGADEIADDLLLVTLGPSVLSDIGFSIWNGPTTGRLNSYRVTTRFYDAEHHLLGQDSYVWNITVAPQEGILLFSSGGFYTGFGISLTNRMFMSIQFSDVQGIDPGDIGVFVAGPRTTGYSSQLAYNLTNGQAIDFDGTDQTNIKLFVDTVNIPSPATPVAAFAAFAAAVRRRR